VLSSAADTEYATWVIREGLYYGYHPSTVYTDGISQRSSDGGASWSSLGRVPDANDLQFYLSTSPGAEPRVEAPSESGSPTDDRASAPDSTDDSNLTEPEEFCRDANPGEANGAVPPEILDVTIMREGHTAVVEWHVDPAATGQVMYHKVGASGESLLTTFEPNLLDFHRQRVPSVGQPALEGDSDYAFKICVTTAEGRQASTEIVR